tara:strand:- start:444 stop:2093 length:1650 start_codon:yes stop_codon:yes gene_type:complete
MAASQPFGFSCKGGLNTNLSQLELLQQPGSATELINFEVDPDGGYRRINGFLAAASAKPNGDNTVLGMAAYAGGLLVCSGTGIFWTFNFVSWVQINRGTIAGGEKTYTDFVAQSLAARTSQGRCIISIYEGNLSPYGEVVICDGVNTPFYFYVKGTGAENDGTRRYVSGPLVDHSHQTLGSAAVSTVHGQQLVLGRTAADPNEIYTSALNDISNFAGTGSNAIRLADKVVGLKSFRGDLIVFCKNSIYKVLNLESADASTAVVPITKNIGCLDANSIQEIGGDLVFLAPDGIRTLAGTARIGDVELTSASRNIQKIISKITRTNVPYDISSLVLRNKSQYRLFYSKAGEAPSTARGIIGTFTGQGYEWSETCGIEAVVASSELSSTGGELAYHGDRLGQVYSHDDGNKFIHAGADANIKAEYQSPSLDFGDMGTRKTIQYVKISATPDDNSTTVAAEPKLSVSFDFEDTNIQQPPTYTLPSIYPVAEFGVSRFSNITYTSYFGAADNPLIRQPVQGSCYSSAYKISSEDQLSPYTINGLYINYVPAGRR